MYSCLIIDDEALALSLLQNHIKKIPFLECKGAYQSVFDAQLYLNENEVDILFLDIQMPELSGLDFLKLLPRKPAVVFTTAYSEYALDAFEQDAVDYLVKPIEFDRFFKSVNKALRYTGKLSDNELKDYRNPERAQQDELYIKSDQRIVKIRIDDILYIEGLQKYVKIHTEEKVWTTLVSMSKTLQNLPAQQFFRVHKSYIINLNKIKSIEGNMIWIGDKYVPVSKGQKDVFLKKIREKGLF